jgi:hypothetical protein
LFTGVIRFVSVVLPPPYHRHWTWFSAPRLILHPPRWTSDATRHRFVSRRRHVKSRHHRGRKRHGRS